MKVRKQMEIISDKRKSLKINDDFGIEKCWNEMAELLSENENGIVGHDINNSIRQFLFNLLQNRVIVCKKNIFGFVKKSV
ncbi:hypothetical protein [Listeria booriae]|uniref:hypothetical protein n=1 Tax=Listeria booriae TaxID=1552123 RepID=UPI00162AC496|nr:hypothetical protein [Listeria booriae]MBC1512093.1 hypothetical protein [Listeria booriae]MBC6306621.1 hypothetical protein [Listeria booriae]